MVIIAILLSFLISKNKIPTVEKLSDWLIGIFVKNVLWQVRLLKVKTKKFETSTQLLRIVEHQSLPVRNL
jgi:hypothetical protein